MYTSKIKHTGPVSVYNKVTNSRKICWYCGTQNIHTAGKKVSFSTLLLIPETSTIEAALPQVAFKKSKSLNVYVLLTHRSMKTYGKRRYRFTHFSILHIFRRLSGFQHPSVECEVQKNL
jgi:hypothetical protein